MPVFYRHFVEKRHSSNSHQWMRISCMDMISHLPEETGNIHTISISLPIYIPSPKKYSEDSREKKHTLSYTCPKKFPNSSRDIPEIAENEASLHFFEENIEKIFYFGPIAVILTHGYLSNPYSNTIIQIQK